jgi:hypothetical protein
MKIEECFTRLEILDVQQIAGNYSLFHEKIYPMFSK